MSSTNLNTTTTTTSQVPPPPSSTILQRVSPPVEEYSNFNGRADTDPMYINYVGAITFGFQNTPIRSTMAYEVYKSIFIQDRNRFGVISKLHQNNSQDQLHFSVSVDVINNWFHTLHYNGWWDGDRFLVMNITALTYTRDKQEILETIAVFNL
jgi:hypothetical protein